MLDGKKFFEERGMPILKTALVNKSLALADPVPFTLAKRMTMLFTLVNFVIINLAPGDPVSYAEISPEGNAARRDDRALAFSSDQRYLVVCIHHKRPKIGLKTRDTGAGTKDRIL